MDSFPLKEIFGTRIVDDWQTRTAECLKLFVLQPLRNKFGEALPITSGFRTPDESLAAGGAASSEHDWGHGRTGRDRLDWRGAVDIAPKVSVVKRLEMYKWLMVNCSTVVGQVIWYVETGHIHISLATPLHQGEFLCCVSKKTKDYRRITSTQQIVALDGRLRGAV